MTDRPGGALASRPLHFIWILDCSGSMTEGGKIGELNFAIHEALPEMRRVADENPHAQVLVRAVTFANDARWHVTSPTPVNDFKWADVSAGGETKMGKALSIVAKELKVPPMTERALPPVLVLVSDGQPTDNFDAGLQELMAEPWGKKAVRIAISIGKDADLGVLQKFIGKAELAPLRSDNPKELVNNIRWASTAALAAASSPMLGTDQSLLQALPPQPNPVGTTTADDIW